MIALLWILLAWLSGWLILKQATGDTPIFFATSGETTTGLVWPVWLWQISGSFCLGLLFATWLTYLTASLIAALTPDNIHPLVLADTLIICLAVIFFAIYFYRRRKSDNLGSWPTLVRSLKTNQGLYFAAVLFLWLFLGYYLMHSTFYQTGNYLHAGFSVFGDFAPHTALTSSFSQGRNWPTVYPHFGQDGISYHFMFYFLCANLHLLGLPLDWAINLPSILFFTAFCLLLGAFAYKLLERTIAFLLVPLLFLLRSSLAFFFFLIDQSKRISGPGKIGILLKSLWQQNTFIGNTMHDDWGLWGVNVLVNQRHFLAGLALALLVLTLIWPDFLEGLNKTGLSSFFQKEHWRIKSPLDWRRYLTILALVACLPYWHGSVLIWLLAVLLPLAFKAVNRLGFVLIACTALASSLIQTDFFQAHLKTGRLFFWGFLATDKSLPGVLWYLLSVAGLLLPLVILAFFRSDRPGRMLILALFLPVILAFTLSLTPDVTVNHKYLIASFALMNIFSLKLLLSFWQRPKANLVLTRLAAVLLFFALTVTGVQEWIILRNINQNTVTIQTDSKLAQWVSQNSSPQALFVTAPYHYHNFFLSGRSVFLGHSYYAWSAGHDTAARQRILERFFSTTDLDELAALIADNKLTHLIIDDQLRQDPLYTIDEDFWQEHFVLQGYFSAEGNARIFDLSSLH